MNLSLRLPVVLVGLRDKAWVSDDAARWPAWESGRQTQATLALPCAAKVSAPRLPQNSDEPHLCTAALRTLGQRLAAETNDLWWTCY